ncbi:MAG: hypothetical protein ABIP39_01030 [Polyangiaceae bacterium]
MLVVSGCGSTEKASPAGPCPERTEPLAGAKCAAEGTQCEYVIAGTCQTDAYVCTDGKWATTDMPDAAAGCARGVRTGGDDAAADGAPDAALDAAAE